MIPYPNIVASLSGNANFKSQCAAGGGIEPSGQRCNSSGASSQRKTLRERRALNVWSLTASCTMAAFRGKRTA
jgi:hypothetical protein